MRSPVRIRDVAASRGTKAEGWLAIGETASGPIRVPIVVINGAEDGPILCLTAGVHATEYAPIAAVMELVQSIDAARLRGAVIAVPVTNMRMFESRTGFTSPLDGLNLNKIAPGNFNEHWIGHFSSAPVGIEDRPRPRPLPQAPAGSSSAWQLAKGPRTD